MDDKMISMEEFKNGFSKTNLIKLREEIDRFRDMADLLKENAKIMAGITKAKYDALVSEGFTPHQALELCKGA